jgi:hypothetical protein
MDRIRRMKRNRRQRQCWLEDKRPSKVPASQTSFPFFEESKRLASDQKEEAVDR